MSATLDLLPSHYQFGPIIGQFGVGTANGCYSIFINTPLGQGTHFCGGGSDSNCSHLVSFDAERVSMAVNVLHGLSATLAMLDCTSG